MWLAGNKQNAKTPEHVPKTKLREMTLYVTPDESRSSLAFLSVSSDRWKHQNNARATADVNDWAAASRSITTRQPETN